MGRNWNLLHNSDFSGATIEPWAAWGSGAPMSREIVTLEDKDYTTWAHCANPTSAGYTGYIINRNADVAKAHVLSFSAFGEGYVQYFLHRRGDGNNNPQQSGLIQVSEEPDKIIIPITPCDNSEKTSYGIMLGAGRNSDVYITKVKLEIGTEATEWCPAADEQGAYPAWGGWSEMAVIARADIPIFHVRDIIGVTRYYKLQASTASVPAKPTTATPSGWNTTEPAYTEGSTNSLYTVEKTTYSDGTFEYSDVSLSSSYEAAKTAYNKSVQAKSTADAAQETASIALSDSVEYIVGTQTAATGTWTGATRETALEAGKTIAYRLPYAGSGNATLELTLANGNKTGAKEVFLNTTRVTTHYGANAVILMTYDGTQWRASSIPNSNTYDRMLYSQAVKASSATYIGQRIICGTIDGYSNIGAGVAFDLTYPLLWYATAATTTVASGSTANNHYLEHPAVPYNANGTIQSGAARKMLYLKGTVSGRMFTIAASPFMTTVVPTTEDGYYYIPLGSMTSATAGRFVSSNRLYAYIDGAFQPIDTAAKLLATKYITKINDDGILVHRENSTDGVRITDEVDILRDGTAVARFGAGAGETAILGKDGSGQVEVSSMGMRAVGADGGEVMTARSSDVLITAPYVYAFYGETLSAVGDTDTVEIPVSSGEFEAVVEIGIGWKRQKFTVGTGATYTLTANGVTASLVYDATENTLTLTVTANTGTRSARLISCKYNVSYNAPFFTFGTREGDPGGFSIAGGAGLYATRDFQTVLGKYNTEDDGDSADAALIIGNGTQDNMRSDAFRVGWDGDIGFFADAAHSAVDEEIALRLGTFEQYVYEAYGNGIMSLKALLLQLIYILQYKFGSLGFSNDTVINSGATQAVTIPTNSTHLMVVTSGGTAQRGMYMVTCTSANATTNTAMHAVSTLTITTGSSGTISVKNTGSQPVRLNFLTMQGNTVGGPT